MCNACRTGRFGRKGGDQRKESAMKLKVLVTAAAVTAALTALAGCDRQADQPPMAAAPTSTPTGPIADRSAGASADSPRSVGQKLDDAGITAKVKAALLASSDVNGSAINVDTDQGRVTLKGKVSDKAEIDRAIQIARAVDGVKEVDSELSASGAG
jgi:hyperosmotically inducible periplasmic protein